jgi:hypothetical protein
MPRGNKADNAPQAVIKEGEDTQPISLNREALSDPNLSREKAGPSSASDIEALLMASTYNARPLVPELMVKGRVRGVRKIPEGESGLNPQSFDEYFYPSKIKEDMDPIEKYLIGGEESAAYETKRPLPIDKKRYEAQELASGKQRRKIELINKREDKRSTKSEERLAKQFEESNIKDQEAGENLSREAYEDFIDSPKNRSTKINNELSGERFSSDNPDALEQLDDLYVNTREIPQMKVQDEFEKYGIPLDALAEEGPINKVASKIIKNVEAQEMAGKRVTEILDEIEELKSSISKEAFSPIWKKAAQLAEVIRGNESKRIPPNPSKLSELEELLDSITQMPTSTQGNLNLRGTSPATIASSAQQRSAALDRAFGFDSKLDKAPEALEGRTMNELSKARQIIGRQGGVTIGQPEQQGRNVRPFDPNKITSIKNLSRVYEGASDPLNRAIKSKKPTEPLTASMNQLINIIRQLELQQRP